MLDIRIATFLSLSETKSYTKTANILNITQPTVTGHIKYLEKKYQTKLVEYSGKTLTLTKKGEELRDYALSMNANNQKINEAMLQKSDRNKEINFGSTLTIGEFVMPNILINYLDIYPNTNITMLVDNTKILLKKLEEGTIDFAVIEGYFDKEKYDHQLFKAEKFIGVCGKSNPLSEQVVSIENLKQERLITREKGSGTRDILETILHEKNLSIYSFKTRIEIGNFNAIKEFVQKNLGITFVYEEVIKKELQQNKLSIINLTDFHVTREFNIVFLKDDVIVEKYLEFWDFMKRMVTN